MKKLLSIIMLPLLAIMTFVGCGCDKDRSIADINAAYVGMVETFKQGEENLFFSDSVNESTIKISYSGNYSGGINDAINNTEPSNDLQRRYRALYYQQAVLTNIFKYYEDHQDKFYRVASSADIDEDEVTRLYNRVVELKDSLVEFKTHYDAFIEATDMGLSDVMRYDVAGYSFQLNKVIDKSFDFIYSFIDMYEKYCIEDYSIYSQENIISIVDKAYVDMSYIVYLENIKAFNQTIGSGNDGLCDMTSVISNTSESNLTPLLEVRGMVSPSIYDSIGTDTEQGRNALDKLNILVYYRDIYEQRLEHYKTSYNNSDIYALNKYKFATSDAMSYESYLLSLSSSDKATVNMMKHFVDEIFVGYMTNLKAIIE